MCGNINDYHNQETHETYDNIQEQYTLLFTQPFAFNF